MKMRLSVFIGMLLSVMVPTKSRPQFAISLGTEGGFGHNLGGFGGESFGGGLGGHGGLSGLGSLGLLAFQPSFPRWNLGGLEYGEGSFGNGRFGLGGGKSGRGRYGGFGGESGFRRGGQGLESGGSGCYQYFIFIVNL